MFFCPLFCTLRRLWEDRKDGLLILDRPNERHNAVYLDSILHLIDSFYRFKKKFRIFFLIQQRIARLRLPEIKPPGKKSNLLDQKFSLI